MCMGPGIAAEDVFFTVIVPFTQFAPGIHLNPALVMVTICVISAAPHVLAFCVTVKPLPATVIVAVREPPLFRATVNLTVPFPLPDPELMRTQLAFLAAVHEQFAGRDTETVPVAPIALKD